MKKTKKYGRKLNSERAIHLTSKYDNEEKTEEEEHMMEKTQIIRMAKEIIALDVRRDELLEQFMQAAGQNAHDLLRAVQNDLYKKSS